jgi:hypothetical protein
MEPIKYTENRGFVFIDWLAVKQRHFERLPIVNGSVIVKCDEDGEIEYHLLGYKAHKGSYETTINVRCDGNTIHIAGNPSRYNKLDNVFGIPDINACLAIYNEILEVYGLPNLELGKAEITRIDLTENICVGENNAKIFLNYISSVNYRGEHGYIYPNMNTVDWHRGSRRHYLKAYLKAPEIERFIRKNKKTLSDEEISYLLLLKQQCEKSGVVRIEYTMKSQLLAEKDCKIVRGDTMGKVINMFHKKNPLENKVTTSNTDSHNIYERAIEAGFTKRVANNLVDLYELWLHGADLKQRMSINTYYIAKKRLSMLGIDVSKPMDITRLTHSIKPIEFIRIGPSDLYNSYLYKALRIAQERRRIASV